MGPTWTHNIQNGCLIGFFLVFMYFSLKSVEYFVTLCMSSSRILQVEQSAIMNVSLRGHRLNKVRYQIFENIYILWKYCILILIIAALKSSTIIHQQISHSALILLYCCTQLSYLGWAEAVSHSGHPLFVWHVQEGFSLVSAARSRLSPTLSSSTPLSSRLTIC